MLSRTLRSLIVSRNFHLKPKSAYIGVAKTNRIVTLRNFTTGKYLKQSGKIELEPPVALKEDHTHIYHHQSYLDPYHWLRDDSRTSKPVLSYLDSENKYATELLTPLTDLSDQLYNEMKDRIPDSDTSLPLVKDKYKYYHRTVKNEQYLEYCRLDERGIERVILDVNTIEGEYKDIGDVQVSPDHGKLGYSLDLRGNETYDLYVKDLNLEHTKLELEGISGEVVWAKDNLSLFYMVLDANFRPYRLFKHKLGQEQVYDELVYEELDDKFWLHFNLSTSKDFLFINSQSSTSTEIFYIDLNSFDHKLFKFSTREKDRLLQVDHHCSNQVLVLSNRVKDTKLINFQLFKCALEHGDSQSEWQSLLPYDPSIYLTKVYGLKDFVVLEGRKGGYTQIFIVNSKDNSTHTVQFQEPIYTCKLIKDYLKYDQPTITFSFTSLVTPLTYYSYDLVTKIPSTLKITKVLGDFDKDKYLSEKLVTNSGVPVSIVYRKDKFNRDGSNPLHLYGYGSYGLNVDPKFNSNVLSLLDRGFVYAIAHVRGGSELGRGWYENQGKLINKSNTFKDFVEVANTLIDNKYTEKSKLSIEGRSAGGLLIGASINLQPNLFNAAILGVPFLDVTNTMMDPTIPLTINEYEEWGDPNFIEAFRTIRNYSPYDNLPTTANVKSKPTHSSPNETHTPAWPHTLIRAGLNDPRVQYWEPAKYTAKLRTIVSNLPNSRPNGDLSKEKTKVMLITSMGAGHFGSTGRYNYLKEIAQDLAFLIATSTNLKPFGKEVKAKEKN